MITHSNPYGAAPVQSVTSRLVVALCCLAVLIGAAGCRGDRSADQDSKQVRAPAVEAVQTKSGRLPVVDAVSGVVRARNQVAVQPEISGIVTEVKVRNGDEVKRGDILVRLDDRRLAQQVASAEAELRQARARAVEARAQQVEIEARVERLRALAREGLTTDQELETVEAQREAARASTNQAKAMVGQARATLEERRSERDRATIRAPVDGRVGRRDVEVGMVVDSSSTLFVLGDFNDLLVEIPLTQEMVQRVETGTQVGITARGTLEEPLAAEVSRISPFLESGSFSTTAEIDLGRNSRIFRPGMFVNVEIQYGVSDSATLVPASCLWEEPVTGAWVVFIVEEDDGLSVPENPSEDMPERERRVRMLEIGILAAGRGEVGVSGIDEGRWVVTLGQHLLHDHLDEDDATLARVRPRTWEDVDRLQQTQTEDLLEGFLAKQRRVAKEFGAALPASTSEVEERLGEGEFAERANAQPGQKRGAQ